MQFSRTLSAVEHYPTGHNTVSAQQPPPELPDALTRAPPVFVQRDGHVPPLQPLYDGPYTVLRRSLHHFTLQIGDKTDKVSTLPAATPQHRQLCHAHGADRPASASEISRRQGCGQAAKYISPPSTPQKRRGNRFPLASRQGVLHAPPLFPLQQYTRCRRRRRSSGGQPATAGLQKNWTFETSPPPVSRSEGSTVEDRD